MAGVLGKLSVLSWNIHGLKAKLKDNEKKQQLLKIIEKYDVVLLQETRIGPKDAEKKEEDNTDLNIIIEAVKGQYEMVKLLNQTEFRNHTGQQNKKTMYLTYFSSRRRGVAIIINKPHKCLKACFYDGDYAWVHVELFSQRYTFMSVYYHQKEQDQLMDSMSRLLKDRAEVFGNKLVIGGDFNTTLDPALDAKKENTAHDAQRERLNKFMETGMLSDVWRETHPGERQYTFSTRDCKSRLDYVFMLKKELRDVQSCEIDNTDLSDHFPVKLTLEDITTRFSQIEL